jgi:hypothetical protein
MKVKLCECGCGRPAPIATKTDAKWGAIQGKPRRFIAGHHSKRHGFCGTPEYQAYHDAKRRCEDRGHSDFAEYGGRGIKFLFTNFVDFIKEVGRRPKGQMLDRKDNSKHYIFGNVRWVTPKQSAANRRVRKDAR